MWRSWGMVGRFTETRLGELAYFEMGQSPSSAYVSEDEIGLPFLQGNAEFGVVFPKPQSYCSQPKKKCKQGDVLISVRAPVGDLNKADQTYVIGRGLAAIRFTEAPARFGWHLLDYWARHLRKVAQGTTFKAVSKSNLNNLRVLLPPAVEQRCIADILDSADEAIRQSERVIAKLREVKKGLLHDLLTRGIDATGNLRDPEAHPEQFKDSPLGRIPREWRVATIGDLSLNKGDYGSGAAAREYSPDLPRYVRITDITDDGRLDSKSRKSISRPEAEGYYLQEGDLLFARSGTVGKTYLYQRPDGGCAHAGYVIKYSLNPEICDPEFVFYWTQSEFYWSWVKSTLRQGAQPNINAREYRGSRLIQPPVEEQHRIAHVLNGHDARIRAEEAALHKLRQVKRGLMDDLLTGRVRV